MSIDQITSALGATEATIVSLMPWRLAENKPLTYPGSYEIEPVPRGEVRLLHIGQAMYRIYLDDERGWLRQYHTAAEMAEIIINDYINSQLFAAGDLRPGLFWVPGKLTEEQVKKIYKDRLEEARANQEKFLTGLVRAADDLWATNKQIGLIPSICKLSAEYLGLTREWTREVIEDSKIQCPVCRSMIHHESIVCAVCKTVINATEFEKFKKAV